MLSFSVWQSIDRRSFFENTILLSDEKYRSQGHPLKMKSERLEGKPIPVDKADWLLQMAPDFLDDFSLVASGRGGPENVTATCLELSDDEHTYVLRVARNSGVSSDVLEALNDIIATAREGISTESEWKGLRMSMVAKVLHRCKFRIKEQAVRLNNRLQYVYGHDYDEYFRPTFDTEGSRDESRQDIDDLGQHCNETHNSYMTLCEKRLRELKNLTAEVASLGTADDPRRFQELSQLAYSVRKSNSFEKFIQANLNRRPEPGISIPSASKIIERLGKISKIYRAALTVANFVAKIKDLGREIGIEAVPTAKIPVPELADRTAAQLRVRAGYRSRQSDGNKLKRMLERWSKYRQHAEIQLIVFYEENPYIHLCSNHIGCNKHACYLCFNFIKYHARFEVDGSHQSLYSLWTVKDIINFDSLERAQTFHAALRKVSMDVEEKFRQLKAANWRYHGFTTANESPTNLSRISLSSVNPLRQSDSPPASQTYLRPIQEVLPEDITEEEDQCKLTVLENLNNALTQTYASDPSLASSVEVRTLSPNADNTAPYSLPSNHPSALQDASPTCVNPLDIGSRRGRFQHISSDFSAVGYLKRSSSSVAPHNLLRRPRKARVFDEQAVLSTQVCAHDVILRRRRHRKRHRHLHYNISTFKEESMNQFTTTEAERTSIDQLDDSLHRHRRSRRRKRKQYYSTQRKLGKALPKSSLPRDRYLSNTIGQPRKKGARSHKRKNQPNFQKQGCFSGLFKLFRYLWS